MLARRVDPRETFVGGNLSIGHIEVRVDCWVARERERRGSVREVVDVLGADDMNPRETLRRGLNRRCGR
jgi:hypothetical protein